MNALAALTVVAGLVAIATAGGLLSRARRGRVRRADGATRVTPAELDAQPFGSAVTLLQFSTEFCAACKTTARILGELARTTGGAVHVDVDLTARPELARRYRILQTPTTFILDRSGVV